MQLLLNYAHADKGEVKQLIAILESARHTARIDLPESSDYASALTEALGSAETLIHIISPKSLVSEWCQWLLAQAIKLGKPIVPILLYHVDEIPALFRDKPYIDLSEGVKPEAVAQLVSSLYTPLTIPPEQAPPAPAKPEGKPAHALRDSLIFISYSKKNLDYARRLEIYLEEQGFSVWIDKEGISYGDQWVRQIKNAIETCAVFVVLMTPEAEASEWVQRELHYAEEWRKPIFPLLLSGKIWFQLGTIQVLDVTDNSLPPEGFLSRLAAVAPREIQAAPVPEIIVETPAPQPETPPPPPLTAPLNPQPSQVAQSTKEASKRRQTLFLSCFEDDPVVKPYRAAIETLVAEEFSDSWRIVYYQDVRPDQATSVESIEEAVRGCTLFMLILGPFYGHAAPGQEVSYTEYELRLAQGHQKPCMAFVLDEPVPSGISVEFLAEQGATVGRQLQFSRSLDSAQHITNMDELREKVRQSLRDVPESQPLSKPKTFYTPEDQSHLSYDRRTLEAYDLNNLDQEALTRFLERPLAREVARRAEVENPTRKQHMNLIGLMQEDKITLAAFLCFAPFDLIAKHIPACTLQMVVYSDVKRAAADADINLAQGNLLELWNAGSEFFHGKSGLRKVGKVGSDDRDELEIPIIALREALANALIHRDYESPVLRDQPVMVEVYPDRVEITSFGGLPDGISVAMLNNDPEKALSIRRNPALAMIFQYMAYMELNGSGVSRMQEAAREAKLPVPLIEHAEAGQATVKVTFRRQEVKKRAAKSSKAETEEPTQPTPKSETKPAEAEAKKTPAKSGKTAAKAGASEKSAEKEDTPDAKSS